MSHNGHLLAIWNSLWINCFYRIFQKRKMCQWSWFLMSFVKMNRKVVQNHPKFLPVSSLLRLINIIRNLGLVFKFSHQITRHNILKIREYLNNQREAERNRVRSEGVTNLRHVKMVFKWKSTISEPTDLSCCILFYFWFWQLWQIIISGTDVIQMI